MNKSFFKFALFFYPVFTFPPLGVHYSPLTALILSVPGMFIMAGKVFHYRLVDIFFIMMAACVVVVGFLNGFKYGYGISEIAISLAPVFVGLGVYFYVSNMRGYDSKGAIISVLPKVHYLVLAVGLLEFLCMLSLLPREVKVLVSEFFSGVSSSRIQLLTREASWASIYLLIAFPFVYYYAPYYRREAVVLSVFLFVVIFSAYGILCAALAYVFYNFFQSKKRVAYLKKILLMSVVLVAAVLFVYNVAVWLNDMNGGSYYTSRVVKIVSVDSFEKLISLDGSVFLRIMYPLYAVDIFLHNPLGVGLVSYPDVFNDYIVNAPYSDLAFKNPEILSDIYNKTADPRSFYTNILIGGGVLAIMSFVASLYLICARLSRVQDRVYRSALSILFFVSLASMFQLGSFALLPFWLASGLIVSSTN